jgi:hypothetical protein
MDVFEIGSTKRTISGLPIPGIRVLENQAGRGGVGIELAIRSDDPAVGGCDLPTQMNDLAFGTNKRDLVGQRADIALVPSAP